MSDKPFVIPKRDEDLYVSSEENFSVDKVDEVDQSEVEENLNDYITNITQWYDILEYFPQFFNIIVHPDLIRKELMLRSVKALTNGFSRLSDTFSSTLPDFLVEPDERAVTNMTKIRSSLPPYLYLLSRLDTILEAEAVKIGNVDKKGKNAKDNFYDDVVNVRKQLIGILESFITRREGNVSAIKILFAPRSLPEGVPRIISVYISKLLSAPENGLARSEMRQLYPSFFQILGFMGFEWRCMKYVVQAFLDKMHTWDYFKKATSFIFLPSIIRLDSIVCESFLDAILNNFKAIEWSNSASTDKVRSFALFTSTLAETHPDFVVKNFQCFYKFLRCEQHNIRCATLSAMEAVVVYFLRHNTQEENHDFIFKVFHEIQFFFFDPSSYVRVRAAQVVSHIICENFLDEDKDVTGDKTKRRFSIDFYAYNVLEKYATLLTDTLVSVRKAAVIGLNEILHRNPFGGDLDYNFLVGKYQKVVEIRENIEEVPDNDDQIIAKLSERFGKFKAVVEEAVLEYFDIEDFPDIDEEPPSEDVQITYYVDLAEELEKSENKKSIIFNAINFCIKCGTFEADRHFMDEIVEFLLTRFHMRNLANMQVDIRTEFIAEERQLRIARKEEELTKQEHEILCAAQFALQMEECMKNASNALKHGQMAEICEIVKFLASCRQFKLRNSESAVMQICSLIYRNDPEIREFVVTAGKNIFFSGNSNTSVSEISTVQNLMQVMKHAKLEDRCVLSDTLVYIFASTPLKQGSLNFLWQTAEKEEDLGLSIIAVQILQPYVKAVPSEGRKNFGRLSEMLKRKHDIMQLEVLRLATFCETVFNPTTATVNELVVPRLRIPSTDNFFQVAIKQLISQMPIAKSVRWNERAKLTFQAIYALCESPDECCSDIIASVLCWVKQVNYKSRTFRFLYKESLKNLGNLRNKLREKNVEVLPGYSSVDDFELKFADVNSEMKSLSVLNNTQDSVNLDTSQSATVNENNVLVNIDPCKPSTYRGFRRFMNLKRRRMKRSTVSWKAKELKWLKKNGEQNEEEGFIDRLKFTKELNVHNIKKVFEQSNQLFLNARELQHQWHTLMERLFFLTRQYIVRSISFVHETMTEGLESLLKALTEIRSMARGKASMMNLPEWAGEHLSPFERDNAGDMSIFKTNQGRIADATEQSVDSVISTQIESAVGYDWFRPGSILSRVWPLVMQTLRFRSRPLISNTLADSAVYCLIKFMLASPNLCRRYISFVFYYLRNAKPDTRSNLIIMLADVAIRHPSSFSKQLRHYLMLIYDINPNVRYTSLLMIHYLYTVKAVQLPGQLRAHLAILIVDSNDFISDMTKHFFHEVVTNHHVSISSVINDVIIRLYALKIKEFDFTPIAEFFFGYIDSVKQADLTMNILCKHLVTAATYKEIQEDYDQMFACQMIICMKLITKMSFHMVNTLDKAVEKFKFLLCRKNFYRLVLELIHIMNKRSHLKPEIKNEIEVFKKHVESLRHNVALSTRYDRSRTLRSAASFREDDTNAPNSTIFNEDTVMEEAEESNENVVDGDEADVEPMQID